MIKRTVPVAIAACAAVLVASVFATGQSSQSKAAAQPTKAPAFSAKGTDGKTHTLSSLTEKGDVFLYFAQDGCPVNDQAIKYYNRLAEAYKGKATMVGVYDGGEGAFRAFSNRHKANYLFLHDPDLKIVRSYKAQASPWMIHVNKEGNIVKVWTGFSVDYLNQMSAAMAGAAKTAVVKIDTTGAPQAARFG
jgi:peroxiredoxin